MNGGRTIQSGVPLVIIILKTSPRHFVRMHLITWPVSWNKCKVGRDRRARESAGVVGFPQRRKPLTRGFHVTPRGAWTPRILGHVTPTPGASSRPLPTTHALPAVRSLRRPDSRFYGPTWKPDTWGAGAAEQRRSQLGKKIFVSYYHTIYYSINK